MGWWAQSLAVIQTAAGRPCLPKEGGHGAAADPLGESFPAVNLPNGLLQGLDHRGLRRGGRGAGQGLHRFHVHGDPEFPGRLRGDGPDAAR